MSADPAHLLADFHAGRPVPLLEFLTRGIKAHEADLARGRRGAVKARPQARTGRTSVAVVEAVFRGLRALEASTKRRAGRTLSVQERARDEVAVLEALPLANRALGGQASDEARVRFICERTGLSASRVEKVIQRINLQQGVHPPAEWGLVDKLVCGTCEKVGHKQCLRHAPREVLFAAFLKRLPPDHRTLRTVARKPRSTLSRIDRAIEALENIPPAVRAARKRASARRAAEADGDPKPLKF